MPALPKPESTFTPCPSGTHFARCVGVIDLGTRENTFDGQTRMRHEIMVTFETPSEQMDNGDPFTISGWYTWSMNEAANLRLHLESWRGKAFTDDDFGDGGFEIKNILGVPAMITVGTTKGGKAKLIGVGPLPKGTEVPPQINPTRYMFLTADEFDREVFASLGDTLKERIMETPEYKALTESHADDQVQYEPETDTDTPF